MPNANTIAEGLHNELQAARDTYRNLTACKSDKEAALRTIRRIEAELDLPADEQTPSYN